MTPSHICPFFIFVSYLFLNLLVNHILFGKMLSLPKKAVTNQHSSVTAFLSV
jgi:hypothetical protein